jgi:hypothetical protein
MRMWRNVDDVAEAPESHGRVDDGQLAQFDVCEPITHCTHASCRLPGKTPGWSAQGAALVFH